MSGLVSAYEGKDTKQAMLLGLSRTPLPDGNPLTALSLVAMRGKFARPHPPTAAADPCSPYALSTNYLSDDSRQLLLKLLLDRNAGPGDGIALGVLRAINGRGLKLHPFDYARLEDFIAQHAADLGPEERAWLGVVRPERKQDDTYLDSPLTEATLPQAGKAQKLQFLRDLRQNDAAKARELVEALLPNEPASVRAELVGLLAFDLSDADRPLLEVLAKDRAQSVRDAADVLLGRIRGTEAFARRIERLKDHLQLKTEGLTRKHRVLRYAGPTPKSDVDLAEAQRALIVDLPLGEIAAALGVNEQDLLEAASRSQKVGILPFLLLVQAVKDGLMDDARKHVALLESDDGALMVQFLAETLPLTSAARRDDILRLAMRPASWTTALNPLALSRIGALIGGTLPDDVASALLDALERTEGHMEFALDGIAPLIPRSLSARFIKKSESVARRTTLYHRFLLSLPEHPP